MKRVILGLLLSFIYTASFCQKDLDENSSWSLKDRGYLGIGLGGLGFGTSRNVGTYFSIGVTPMAGFMLTKNLSTGLAFEYQYSSYSDLNLKVHQYGWYPFARYNIKDFFIQLDYNFHNVDNVLTPADDRVTYERFFAGIGYSPRGRGRLRSNILLSYDLMYTNTSPFNSPISLRAFFTF